MSLSKIDVQQILKGRLPSILDHAVPMRLNREFYSATAKVACLDRIDDLSALANLRYDLDRELFYDVRWWFLKIPTALNSMRQFA